MPIELGGDPDNIHRVHKQALASGRHPLGNNPAVPPGGAQGAPLEKHASATYRNIIQRLRTYGGVVPNGPRDQMRAAQDMFGTLADVQSREQGHTEQLEQLAVETVMRMPQFKTLRTPLQDGSVKIEAHIGEVSIEGVEFSDTEREEPAEFQVPEIRAEYDEQIHKRKMLNTISQGAAVAHNYDFAQVAFDELADIGPQIVRDYAKLMAYSELGYFMQDPAIARAAAQAAGQAAQGGYAQLRRADDGSILIVAQAACFPMLVHEIIKGCMSYLSHNDEDDPETRALVKAHSDFIDDEMIQMQVGPSIYRELINAIGEDAQETMPYIQDALARMPAREFNEKMQALIAGAPEGKTWFRQLAQDIKTNMEGGQQESLVRRITGL